MVQTCDMVTRYVSLFSIWLHNIDTGFELILLTKPTHVELTCSLSRTGTRYCRNDGRQRNYAIRYSFCRFHWTLRIIRLPCQWSGRLDIHWGRITQNWFHIRLPSITTTHGTIRYLSLQRGTTVRPPRSICRPQTGIHLPIPGHPPSQLRTVHTRNPELVQRYNRK